MPQKRFFSVVIPVHTRLLELEKNLEALENQAYPKEKFEVICIAKKGSKTLNFFSKPKKNFYYFEISSRWPDQKRNEGIRKSKGEIVAFTDDDCLVANNWLEELNSAFDAHPDAAGIEGRTVGKTEKLFSHATHNEKGGFFPTCNLAFKKTALEKVGGFDENYHFFREDIDLAFRIIKNAGPVVFWKKAVAVHPERATNWKSILGELYMQRGDVRLYKKFPQEYKKVFGWVGKGALKQSFVSFVILIASLFFLLKGFWLGTIAGLAALVLFKYFVLMNGKEFSAKEGVLFVAVSFIKDLLAPFFFAKYWIEVKP